MTIIQLLSFLSLAIASVHGTAIRLANGGLNYGRVEVQYMGVWGTVCDDFFDSNSNGAQVVCRSLGLGTVNARFQRFGQGSGPIWLDNVICHGNETDISQCSHNAWGNHNCGHSEDAGVYCDLPIPTTPEPCLVPCNGNGVYTCECHQGYTGADCETEIDYCDIALVEVSSGSAANMSVACQPHGICVSSHSGASCVCDAGWSGPLCDSENKTVIWIGGRCMFRDNPTHTDIPTGCPTFPGEQAQHCVPDDLDCFYQPNCADTIGWCLPLPTPAYERLIQAVTLMGQNIL